MQRSTFRPAGHEISFGKKGLNWRSRLCLCVFFPLAFDFKGEEEGGSIVQYVLLGLTFSFALFTLFRRPFRGKLHDNLFLAFSVLVTCSGFAMAFTNDVSWSISLRVGLQYVLFVLGAALAASVLPDINSLPRFARSLAFITLLSVVFRFVYAFAFKGVHLDDARYQILSAALPVLLAYLTSYGLLLRKITMFSLVGTVAAVAPVVLSVTRSFIITGFCCLIVIVWGLWWAVRSGYLAKKSLISYQIAGLVAAGFLAGGVLLAVILRPGLLETWEARIFESNTTSSATDVTFMTRKAEAVGIWNQVVVSPLSLMFGSGFGTSYSWDTSYAPDLLSSGAVGVGDFVGRTFAPHSVFTGGLLYGGVFGLIWTFSIFICPIHRLLKRTKRNSVEKSFSEFAWLLFLMGCVLYFASQSITSNPMGERLSALLLGFAVNMALLKPKLGGERPVISAIQSRKMSMSTNVATPRLHRQQDERSREK